MTKASGPKKRPHVAKNNANQAAGVYDFVQSPEWQKVLEKARVEQEKGGAEKARAGQQAQPAKQARTAANQPSQNQQSSVAQRARSEHLEQAKQNQNAGISAQTGESDTPPSGDPAADENRPPAETEAGAQPQSSGPDGLPFDPSRDPAEQEADLSLRLTTEEIDYRLSKKLLQKLEDQRQMRHRVRLGLVAGGCLFGVVASSAVFLIASGVKSLESDAMLALEGTAQDFAGIASTQGEPVLASEPAPLVTPGVVDGEIVIASDLFDTRPNEPETPLVEPEDLDSAAAATPPLSDSLEDTPLAEIGTPRLAPAVLSYVPALELPLFPVGVAGYLPRQEANPSFLPYDAAPEFFVSVAHLADVQSTEFEPVEISVAALTAPAPSPKLLALPVTIKVPPALPSVAQPASVLNAIPLRQADTRPLAASEEIELFTVSLQPSTQGDYPELSAETMTAPIFTPRPATPPVSTEVVALPDEIAPTAELPPVSTEVVAVPDEIAPTAELPPASTQIVAVPAEIAPPVEPAAPATGAQFRLYAPNRLSESSVNAVVADLANTGHALSGTARVGYKVSQSNVRYYHAQDAARAAALAEDAGALLRDFTGANSKTPTGLVELYLAGEGGGAAPVRRATQRTNRNSAATNRTSQLRNQVLKKLRATTN